MISNKTPQTPQPQLILSNKGGDVYLFSQDTAAYQTRNEEASYRWAKQDRLNNAPNYQFIGVDEETINLTGVIYPFFKGGLHQITDMKKAAAKGEILIFTEGDGTTHGKCLIASITNEQSFFNVNASPKKITFSMSLLKHNG